MLHRIWLGLFVVAFISALYQWLGFGDAAVFQRMVTSLFDMAGLSVELAIGLIGLMALWLGIVAIGEACGLVDKLARLLSPLFTRLMPEVPAGHPAISSMTLNLAANILGLDNAATPLGLKAMERLQEGNPQPTRATDSQIMFLVLNTSSVTLVPVTVLLYRAQQGSADPAAVYLPMLMATTVSTFIGVMLTARLQRIPLRDPLLIAVALGWLALLAVLALGVYLAPPDLGNTLSGVFGNGILLAVIGLFFFAAWRARIDSYDCFVEGAKDGFDVALRIIPYLVAILVAVGMLRASGALELPVSTNPMISHQASPSGSSSSSRITVISRWPFSAMRIRSLTTPSSAPICTEPSEAQ